MLQMHEYADERLHWTPEGNPSVQARDRAEGMFPTSGGVIGAIAQAKSTNLVTADAYSELIQFEEMVFQSMIESN